MLTLSIIAGALVWISALSQHIGNLTSHSAKWVMSDRSQPVSDDGFAGKSAGTLRNKVESCAMYVPAAFLSLVLHQSSSATGVTAGVYAAIRTIFTLCYRLKFNSLRSLSWLVGMICTAVMAALALQVGAFAPA
jgi:uncharacterized MAPEG superfamily protein